ncbi:MAG: phosphoenolpyruvate--protein phosphotransferase [Burkholderiales bacterium]|nr:phosphoenolpyruvate--protein phosphotransferase [Burkholderiales bacterium]
MSTPGNTAEKTAVAAPARAGDAWSGASFTLHGAGVSAGIAIGRAHLVSAAQFEVAHYEIEPERIDAELRRFDAALAQVRGELVGLRASLHSGTPAEMSAFLDVHLMILDDAHLSQASREMIAAQRCNAEWALVQQMLTLTAQFDEIEDAYLRERKADVVHVVEKILKAMPGNESRPLSVQSEDSVVIARDLSPADMIAFKHHRFAGFATDMGGVTSHSAIVARSLNIPAIVGLHNARALLREGETVIVDGREGVLIVNPGPRVLEEYRERRARIERSRARLRSLRGTPAATREGVAVELHANIELPEDVALVRESGASGIGLFRSEFLFLNRESLPEEDEQFEAYRHVVRAMAGLPVTIRTLDLGADKTANGRGPAAPNPALGLRAIRLCLAEPRMFQTQLRAILRASHYGPIRLLVPMLAHAHEIAQTLDAIRQAKASLDAQAVPYDRALRIGGMVEIPGAALALGEFLKHLEFLSIGTNDLVQYTLAIDRTDDSVAHLYDPLHPAVLYLVAQTLKAGKRAGIPVAVCGEMAGELAYTRLLLGLGLREFSMHPAQLPAVKRLVLSTTLAEVESLAARLMRTRDAARRRALIEALRA